MHRPRRLAGVLAALLTATVVGTATPAQAAPPNVFGFVLWNGSVVPSGTQPATTSVALVPPGIMEIHFPGIGAPGGVVHVTALNDAPRWCQAVKWWQAGVDEFADIACYASGGVLNPTQFSAIFESRFSPPSGTVGSSFGYVDVKATGGLISQYNSAGALNAVAVIAPGVTEVKLPGLSTPGGLDGSLQATAVNGGPARCKVRTWTSTPSGQDAVVTCFNAAGAPFATEFTLTYQYQQSLYGAAYPPKWFGYLYNKPVGGPSSTNFNSILGPGANSVSIGGTGLYPVVFPSLAVPPDDLQVTAVGAGSDYCNMITEWVHSGADILVREVACYTNTGVRDPSGFTISANSAL